jgi:putative transposase
MSRRKRILLPDHFYHIVCRGNRRDPLFCDQNDFIEILHMLEKIYDKIPYELVAYCLMTNHYHLLLRSKEQPISKVMSHLNKRYANYYNTKYCLTGHVFEKRFFSDIILDTTGMLEVSRYIHLNPVKANMVKSPGHYPYSSFHFYTQPSLVPPRYIDTQHLLNYFSGSFNERRERYIEFVNSNSSL